MEIDNWSPSNQIVAGSKKRPSFLILRPRAVGAVASLILHVVLLFSAVHVAEEHPPDVQTLGATPLKTRPAPEEPLVLVELPNAGAGSEAAMTAAPAMSTLTLPIAPPIQAAVTFVDIAVDDATDNTSVDTGDAARRALLFGRYSGQIQARIERAWRRPRSPLNPLVRADAENPSPGTFRCQVRILQDAKGAVQEVQMLNCNGTVAWQQSLVTAILSASPLPPPPDPAVFAPSLTMTFEGQAYMPGMSPDGYEIGRLAGAASMENTH